MPSIVNYGGASSATRESHPELQKGIKLLRRSVGCICAYGFGLLSLSAPSDMPIFDALSELLTVLSMKESRTRLVTCLKTLFSLLFFLASQFSYVFGTVNRCTNFVWSLGCTSLSDEHWDLLKVYLLSLISTFCTTWLLQFNMCKATHDQSKCVREKQCCWWQLSNIFQTH